MGAVPQLSLAHSDDPYSSSTVHKFCTPAQHLAADAKEDIAIGVFAAVAAAAGGICSSATIARSGT